jgi:hypothetical protein
METMVNLDGSRWVLVLLSDHPIEREEDEMKLCSLSYDLMPEFFPSFSEVASVSFNADGQKV